MKNHNPAKARHSELEQFCCSLGFGIRLRKQTLKRVQCDGLKIASYFLESKNSVS